MRKRWPWAVATLVLLAAGAVTGVLVATAPGHGAARTSPANPLGLPASERFLLGLTELDAKPAPGFSLTDQHGRSVSLARLRGHLVALEFMDPRCTDVCPIVSRELIVAARRLGARSRDVEFVAVNVNQYHERVADVAAFSKAHGLSRLPNWRFLTGPTQELRAVWKAYGVTVEPNESGDVVHSSLLYFIDREGRMRWLAWPDRSKALIDRWGAAIADVARAMLAL